MDHKINEEVVCVLKATPDNKIISIYYEPIVECLSDEFRNLDKYFEDSNQNCNTILSYIKNNKQLKILFKWIQILSELK